MDIPDTLTLARVDRKNQGPWEAEYSYGGEADLHQHHIHCDKNPGHDKFISIDKFSIEDLPEDYRVQDMVDYIRAVSVLTVRVTVKYISDRRPATIPGSDKPYPGYSARGTQRMTVGTGRVTRVRVFDNSEEEDACECKDCKNSSTSEKRFAIINIHTATHVLFDKLEAEYTTFDLFFDRGNRPQTCQGVVTLTGGLIGESDINGDNCEVQCFTHDLDLAYRLKKTLIEMISLDNHIKIKYGSYGKCKRTLNVGDKQPLLFIVSHPHGCSKQISLGRLISVHTFDNKFEYFHYSTPTCPGSSGAPVFLSHMLIGRTMQMATFYVKEIHCGASEDHPGINYYQTDKFIPFPQSWSVNMLKFDKGLWEDLFSCAEEKDLLKESDTCHMNPGHQNFFPADKFSMDNLPLVYRTDDIFDFIKIVSDLTVRVSVKYVSEERPETVPGTDLPYPWYSHRGSNKLREGNGWIANVQINGKDTLSKTCDCKECRSSLSPKTEFAYFCIGSATHLVYDRMEAEQTTCQLVVDSRVVTFTDICDSYYSFDHDMCKLTYVSHDLDVANNINNLINSSQLTAFNSSKFAAGERQNARKKMSETSPLYVVVSHPHGFAKQISISYCSNHDNTETEDNHSPYSSIMCPGSSGAPLFKLGWETLYILQ